MSTEQTPHALHWGYREGPYGELEMFGSVRVTHRRYVSEGERKPGDIINTAMQLRADIAKALGCSPDRIRFITPRRLLKRHANYPKETA